MKCIDLYWFEACATLTSPCFRSHPISAISDSPKSGTVSKIQISHKSMFGLCSSLDLQAAPGTHGTQGTQRQAWSPWSQDVTGSHRHRGHRVHTLAPQRASRFSKFRNTVELAEWQPPGRHAGIGIELVQIWMAVQWFGTFLYFDFPTYGS